MWLEKAGITSRAKTVGCCILLALLASVFDHWAGRHLDISDVYLAPIALATLSGGAASGGVLSVFCTVLWLHARFYGLPFEEPLESFAVQFWNGLMRLGFFLAFTFTLAALRRAWERQKELARTDSLTGIANKRRFMETAQEELGRARRHSRPLSLAFMDLDNFKEVNDRWGHMEGDEALRSLAQSLSACVRAGELLARVGGDEFALLLPEAGAAGAALAIERLRKVAQDEIQRHGWPVSFSIGLVTFEKPPADLNKVLQAADALMYDVKTKGKNGLRHEVLSADAAPTAQSGSDAGLVPPVARRTGSG